MPAGTVIDSIVVNKSERQLLAYSRHKLIRTFPVSLGKKPIGKKEFEGDGKTPEGRYLINGKNAQSGYHKNLGISYPDLKDRAHAQKAGKSPGGDVKIHGLRNDQGFIARFQRWRDWTNGCIALTNAELDDLYSHTQTGTPIQINK